MRKCEKRGIFDNYQQLWRQNREVARQLQFQVPKGNTQEPQNRKYQ